MRYWPSVSTILTLNTVRFLSTANSSEQDAGTLIPTTGGSINTSGNEGNYPATTNIQVTINGTDLESASTGDGVKIVKVFVKTAAGIWSVA